MIRSFVLNSYLAKEFLKTVLNICLFFLCVTFLMNLLEELNFFKDYEVSIKFPIILTALYIPNLLYNMFPFLMLLSGIWFFWKIKKSDEVIALKVSGMSNFSIIIIPSILSLILGIFIITSVNPITSTLIKKYEMIKGSFEKDKEYLAAITDNGIWIKEKNFQKNNIIRSKSLNDESLTNVTIYQFDRDNNFIKRIEADSANISSLNWKLKNVTIIDPGGKILSENIENYSYLSMYDIKKIKSLYSNLDTVSFWNLGKEIKLLETRGYSTREMKTKLHRSLAFPFFLLSMILLSGFFTLGVNLKENNWSYLFVAITVSVLIYFFNDFSAVLGKIEKLPIEIAVWMPITIIFIFGAVGIIHANQK